MVNATPMIRSMIEKIGNPSLEITQFHIIYVHAAYHHSEELRKDNVFCERKESESKFTTCQWFIHYCKLLS